MSNRPEMSKFVHLHVHTQYSILDGQASINALVDKAMADGMPALAITDHGNMFGIKEFFNYVSKKNSKTKGAIKEAKQPPKRLKRPETSPWRRKNTGKQMNLRGKSSNPYWDARSTWPMNRC